MPRWTRPADIKARLRKRWERGDFLKAAVAEVAGATEAVDATEVSAATPAGGEGSAPELELVRATGAGAPAGATEAGAAAPGASLGPYRVPITGPTPAQMVEQFDAVREWVGELSRAEEQGTLALEWTEKRHRQFGRNKVPRAAVFSDLDSVAACLGHTRALRRAREATARLLRRLPALAGWASANPFMLLEHESALDTLASIAEWLQRNLRPGIYVREVSLPGVDTKLIERHRGILAQWLDHVLPPETIDERYSRGRGFERRYGFRVRPELVRFRLLDPALREATGYSDMSVPVEEFAARPPAPPTPAVPPTPGQSAASGAAASSAGGISTVFVTENDMNGLAFPDVPGGLVVFGRGYSFESLAAAQWLHRLPIHYWGDIDTHGFAILSQFRSIFPHAHSILMDRETLLAHRERWGTEPSPTRAELTRLTTAEASLYAELRENRLGRQVRLEQELVDFSLLGNLLSAICAPGS